KALDASTSSSSTCRIPRFVNLTVGGMEKIMVAMTPGTTPSPKNTTAGIKYTNAGIVCMKSRIGVITDCTVCFCDIQIPKGTPILNEINTVIILQPNALHN